MLFLLRTDEELGIKRETDAVDVNVEPAVSAELPEDPEAIPPPEKKRKGKKKSTKHATNRTLIKDINKAYDDYMFAEDSKIVSITEKILCIDSKSDAIDNLETKEELRTKLAKSLHTNLESVFESIHNERINVNAPLNTSTFNRDYRDLKMLYPKMVFRDISKSAKQAQKADASLDESMQQQQQQKFPGSQPWPAENEMGYDDGYQQYQPPYYEERTTKKSKRGRKEGKFKRFL